MGLQRGRKTASLGTGSRIWWNWQTRYFEVVVGQPVQVQVLLCAPIFSGGMTSQRRPAKSDCCRLIRSSQIAPTPENHTLLEDLEIRFWRLESVIKIQDLLLEHPLGLVALLRERVKCLRESVIEPRQNRNL